MHFRSHPLAHFRSRCWVRACAGKNGKEETLSPDVYLFRAEIFVPDSTPMQVFTSLYEIGERQGWDNSAYEVNEIVDNSAFNNQPFGS